MKQIIVFLTYVYIFLLPFGNLFRIKVTNGVQIVPQDIIVGLIALLISSFLLVTKKELFTHRFIKYQLLFLGVGTVSLFLNFILHRDVSLIVSLLYSVRYFSYLMLFFVGVYFLKADLLSKLLYGALIVFLILGFVQYFFFYDLRPLFYLGWDNHLYRLTSTLYDPNFTGIFLSILFWLSIFFSTTLSYRKALPHIFIGFASVVGIYLTFSRTSLVGLVVGILVYGLLKKQYKTLTVTIAVLSVLVLFLSDTHIEGLNPFRVASTNQRLTSISQTITIIEKNPILGVGFNAYRYAQLRYGLREPVGASVSNSDAGADNSLLFAVATTGFIGIVIYLLSFISLFKDYFSNKSTFSYILIAILSGLIMGSFFTNILFFTPIIGVLFMLIPLKLGKIKVDK